MTRNRNFKRLVRDRMAMTGERYATARAHVVARLGPAETPDDTGVFPAVTAIGGQQPDLAAARNLCANAGIVGPDGGPLSEAMAFGLAGGIGFLYGVFEYDDGPTMTIVARSESMPDPFVAPLFARAGAELRVDTTGGSATAARHLDAVIAEGTPALCTVGAGGLAYLGEASDMAGMAPHLVGVVGVAGDGSILIDDRSPVPIAVPRDDFDRARAAYRKAKHRLCTITGVVAGHDWGAAVIEAVAATATGFDTPPVPQFASNVGLPGLEKFHRLLTDERDPKRWRKVFAGGRSAAVGLSRLHDCIEYAYTAPSAGRPLYATFLDDAAGLVDRARADRWRSAAEDFRASGERWASVAALAVGADPALERYAELAGARAAALDGAPNGTTMVELAAEQSAAVDNCPIGAGAAADVFDAVAGEVGVIIELERSALDTLRAPG
ncbi:MAG: BtrH N-terminal domain-containing protein [Actinomycetota bacterium]